MSFSISNTTFNQSGIDTSLAGITTMVAAIPVVAVATAYSVNTYIKPPTANGFIYRCTVAGTTAATAPTYGMTAGGTTVDGTASFLAVIAPYSQIVGARTVYRISTFQAAFSGTLTWDAKLEGLEFYDCPTSPVVSFNSPAVITINSVINGKATYDDALIIRPSVNTIQTELRINSGVTFNLNGARIYLSGIGSSDYQSVYINKGATINVTNGWIKSSKNQVRWGESGTGTMLAMNINGLIAEKIFTTIFGVFGSLNGLAPLNSVTQTVAYGAFTSFTLRDYAPLDTGSFLDNYDIPNLYVVNSLGSGLTYKSGQGPGKWISLQKEFTLTTLTAAGASINGAVAYVRDTNNAGRVNIPAIPNQLGDNVYLQATAGAGVTPTMALWVMHAQAQASYQSIPVRDYRTKTTVAGADLFDINVWAYGYNYAALNDVAMKGTGILALTSNLIADANVTLTEANAVTKLASSFTVVGSVLTVTASSTLDDIYDVMKAYKTRNVQAQVEYPTISTQPVTASGTALTTAMTIVVSSGAVLSGGTKFKSITTGGTVGITGAALSSITINNAVTQATPTALTNVTITGSLTYNTATTAQFTFTGSSLATVNNSGAGIVTIKKVSSTLTAGTNVVAYNPTYLTFTLNGGRIRVLDNVGVEQYNQTTDGTFELQAAATGTWSYKVVKYGSKVIENTFSIDGTTKAITPAYIPDTFVVDTSANVAAYTNLQTTQKIYDYYSYYLASAAGILVTKTVSLTASLLGLGAYTLANSIIGITGSVIGINATTISGVDVLTTGNQNGVNPTSPQRITDSVATLTWVNIILSGGRIRILNQLGVEQFNTTTDATILLPKASTGTWTYKIVKYGSQPIVGSFSVDGVFKTIAPSYIPDTFVVDTLSNVIAYTSLETSQKIYDYYSYFLTSATGILVTKSVTLTATKLDLGAYTLSNSAVSVSGSVIGINVTTVSGLDIVTTGTQSGVFPTYPQLISDATTISTWLNITLNGGRIRILNNSGVEQFNQTTDNNILLPASSTGVWSYKIVKYGSQPIFGTFTTDGRIKVISASYIPDTFVFDTLANVTAYTSLNTTQKIYDYYSYSLTSATGILVTKSIVLTSAKLDIGNYVLSAVAVGVVGNVIGINTSVISGVNVVTTSAQVGISPTYPQLITDSVTTTTWLNLTLNNGRIRILDNLGAEYLNTTSDGTTLLPYSATGVWSYKIVKYGSQPIFGTFNIDGIIKFISASYIPDTLVVDTLANVTAYTALETVQKIYDYYSLYLASSTGILVTKSVTLNSTLLNLGAYAVSNGALSISSTSIGTNSSTVSGVNVISTGSIVGLVPTYPQQLADPTGTTNWLKTVLTAGQVYQDSFNLGFSTVSSTTLLPTSFGSAITIYVTRRGYKKQTITVPYTQTLLPTQSFNLIPDTNVLDVVTDLANVDLTSSQLIYDAFSQYQSTVAGISDVYVPTKTPGAIDFTSKGFRLFAATDFSLSPLRIKSSSLSSDTYYSQQAFTQGTAALANSVLVRALNLNSELVFTPDALTFYPTSLDRNSGTNVGVSVTGGIYRFLHGAVVSGVTLSGTLYLRVTVGGLVFFADLPIVSGANVMDLGVQGQLTAISAKLDTKPSKLEIGSLVWETPLDAALTAKKVLNTTAAALAGKATGGGTPIIALRNLSDTANAIVMAVDVNGNRSNVVIAP